MGVTIDPKALEKRKNEIDQLMAKFIGEWNSNTSAIRIKSRKNASKKISELYFEILHGVIKGYYLEPDGATNRFKVAAVMEFSCMKSLPIEFETPGSEENAFSLRRANAFFAFYIASSMMFLIHLHKNPALKKTILKSATREGLIPILRNRIDFLNHLELKNPFEYPTLNSANFWEAFLVAATIE